jgi:hypothetical protein
MLENPKILDFSIEILAADSSISSRDSPRNLFQAFQCVFQVPLDELYPMVCRGAESAVKSKNFPHR